MIYPHYNRSDFLGSEREKLWTKTFIITSLVNFFLMLSMFLLIIIMAGYAIDTYKASTSLAGFVSSIFIFGALIGRLYAGSKMNELGTKRILMVGIIIFLILSIFYFFNINIYLLLIVRVVQGIGVGLATTATGTIVSQIIPPSRTGEGIGYFSSSVVLAQAIGPLIGILLIQYFSYTYVFIFSLTIGIVCFLFAFIIQAPTIEVEETETKRRTFKLSNYLERSSIPIASVMLVIGITYSSILSFISTYAETIHLVQAGTFYFVVYAIVVLLTRPISGKVLDKFGGNAVIYPTIIIFAIGMFFISKATSTSTFLFAAALIGLGYGNFQSSTQAIAIQRAPIERMGLANATYFIFYDFSLGLGPLFLGALIPLVGFRELYFYLIFFIIFGLLLYYIAHGRLDKKSDF
ncbi:MAG TPA: MFS transporter [Candidatus Pseudogracilibacillus intestinigallinarum]|uniref:MFS transporter n=1 Tax=Candidatus Pseudogracilibacillus intestinigallinarum TaxID=2838742 RepID=A0A9D1TJS4_9BACI|nr:MFS transporter [Candidatus Pseudogracilibacillus intestinigallinarum]